MALANLSIPVPLDQLVNSGSTMTIEELTGTAPGWKPRRVVLTGGGLPFMGQADWGGETTLVTTWYPGNGDEASQQNLGPKEMPSTWTGEWNRTRMGRTPTVAYDESGAKTAVVDPHVLWLLLDDIRRAGARLRVTWSVKGRIFVGSNRSGGDRPVDFQIVREGRMKSLAIHPDRLTDIKWTAAWEWMSRGKRQAKVADVRREGDPGLASSALAQSIESLDNLLNARLLSLKSGVRFSASAITLGQLEALAGAPLKLVNGAMAKLRYNLNQIKRVTDIARKLSQTPNAIANSVLDFARNTTALCNQTITELNRTPPELLSNRHKASDLARATKYFGKLQDGFHESAKSGTELDLRLRQVLVAGANRGIISVRQSSTTRAGELIAIHVCKTGDTPTRVSTKYYENPDQGATILRANRLPLHTPTFRTGQILVIPALANAPRGT